MRSIFIPLYEGGDKDDTDSYGSVSLISAVVETFLGILCDRIVTQLEADKLVTVKQRRCLHESSCPTNLISFLDNVVERMNGGKRE